jgi:hypothetical protein
VVLDKFSSTEKLSNACSTKNNSPLYCILTFKLYFRWRDQLMTLLVFSIILLDLYSNCMIIQTPLVYRSDQMDLFYEFNAAK